jgi:recombinational DNA repair protein RecR
MKCYSCTKHKSLKTCGACREVKKIDLVNLVLERDPVYLSERTRNKAGRKHVLTTQQEKEIQVDRFFFGTSIRKLARQYHVSVATVHKVVKG